jgi:hypothetical protein
LGEAACHDGIGTPNYIAFAAQYLACTPPCQRFACSDRNKHNRNARSGGFGSNSADRSPDNEQIDVWKQCQNGRLNVFRIGGAAKSRLQANGFAVDIAEIGNPCASADASFLNAGSNGRECRANYPFHNCLCDFHDLLAEGEELGSNLLHVSRRSGTQHIVRRLILPLKGGHHASAN